MTQRKLPEVKENTCCTEPTNGDSECCVDEVGEMVKKLVRVFQLFERDQVKIHGVTTSQCYCLSEVYRAGSMTMNELSQKMNLNTSTITRIVDNLVRDGLLARERDQKDRRVVVVALTEKGKVTAEKLNISITAYYKKIIENIPKGEMNNILDSVSKLLAAFEAANPNCC